MEPPLVAPEFDSLILIDREVDLITPMCSQLTFEGLIDEVYSIHLSASVVCDHAITFGSSNCCCCCKMSVPTPLNAFFPPSHSIRFSSHLPTLLPTDKTEVPSDVVPTKDGAAPRGGDQGRAQLVLNSGSQLYSEIRGMSWPAVGPFLTRRAKTLRADVAEGRDVISGRDLKKMKALTSSKLTHIKVRGKGREKSPLLPRSGRPRRSGVPLKFVPVWPCLLLCHLCAPQCRKSRKSCRCFFPLRRN